MKDLNENAGSWLKVLTNAGRPEHVRFVIPSMFPAPIAGAYPIKFMVKQQCALMYPLGFFDVVTGFGLRSLTDKKFCVYSTIPFALYTSYPAIVYRHGFEFGTPIILTEGVKDAEVVAMRYAYTFSLQGSTVSAQLAEFLSMFTNTVIIVSDKDEAGDKGRKTTTSRLKKHKVQSHYVFFPGKWKDIAEIYEEALDFSSNAIDALKTIYNQIGQHVS